MGYEYEQCESSILVHQQAADTIGADFVDWECIRSVVFDLPVSVGPFAAGNTSFTEVPVELEVIVGHVLMKEITMVASCVIHGQCYAWLPASGVTIYADITFTIMAPYVSGYLDVVSAGFE